MLLVDHKNGLVKCFIAVLFALVFIVGALKTGHFSKSEKSLNLQYSVKAASKAYFNPITGQFEAPPKSSTIDEQSLQAKSTLKSNFVANNTTETDSSETTSSSTKESVASEYKGATVFAIPAHMRSRLMATRSLQDGSLKISHQAPIHQRKVD